MPKEGYGEKCYGEIDAFKVKVVTSWSHEKINLVKSRVIGGFDVCSIPA